MRPCRPAPTPKGRKQGKLTLEEFDLDEEGRVRRCPLGASPVRTSRGKERYEASFNRSVCARCEQLRRCPVRLEPRRARLQYTPERVSTRRRRLEQDTPEFRARYRWRAGIEATLSRLKHQMKLAYLRVRGRCAVKYAIFLRALGLNIRRCASILQTA